MVKGGRPKRRPQREMPSGSGSERTGRRPVKVRDARPDEQTGSRPRLPLWKMLIPGQLDKAVEEAQRESDRLKLEVERLRRQNAKDAKALYGKPNVWDPEKYESSVTAGPMGRVHNKPRSSSRQVPLFERPK